MISPLLAIFYFIIIAASDSAYSSRNHYVVPHLRDCPPQKNCTDINTLLSNAKRYLTSNTTVTIQSGDYSINHRKYKSLLIHNISDLIISGEGDETEQVNNTAVFRCHTDFNIVFVRSKNVQLSNLEFLGCGSQVTHEHFDHAAIYNSLQESDQARNYFASLFTALELQTPAQAATVYFLDCTNVTLERVTVRDPTVGIALLEVNNHHYFAVRECHFESGYRAWRLKNFQHTLVKKAFCIQ